MTHANLTNAFLTTALMLSGLLLLAGPAQADPSCVGANVDYGKDQVADAGKYDDGTYHGVYVSVDPQPNDGVQYAGRVWVGANPSCLAP